MATTSSSGTHSTGSNLNTPSQPKLESEDDYENTLVQYIVMRSDLVKVGIELNRILFGVG